MRVLTLLGYKCPDMNLLGPRDECVYLFIFFYNKWSNPIPKLYTFSVKKKKKFNTFYVNLCTKKNLFQYLYISATTKSLFWSPWLFLLLKAVGLTEATIKTSCYCLLASSWPAFSWTDGDTALPMVCSQNHNVASGHGTVQLTQSLQRVWIQESQD